MALNLNRRRRERSASRIERDGPPEGSKRHFRMPSRTLMQSDGRSTKTVAEWRGVVGGLRGSNGDLKKLWWLEGKE